MKFLEKTIPIDVNGHVVKAHVEVTVEEDDIASEDPAFEPAEGYFNAYILVEASFEGIEGADSIGACECRPNNAFDSSEFTKDVNQHLAEHSMISNALEHLSTQLKARYSELMTEAKRFERFAKGA